VNDQDKEPKYVAPLCPSCGKPLVKGGGFCRECLDRGLGPCEACEGLPLDIEEEP
jgi:predicted amidophosphoribosyltransferase